MKRWLWSQSLQRKTILGMVLVGLLPLALSLFLTYVEERRALREITGSNFKGIAVEVARKIETQIMRGINEAQQLATIPFIRAAVKEANRSYEGRESEKIKAFIEEWKERWRARKNPHEFPAFVNRIATNYLVDWHAVRKSDYLGILVTDNQGALVLSSLPQVRFYHGDAEWWEAAFRQGQGQIYVSDLTFDPSFGTHVLNVAVPIFDQGRHQALGTVSIVLRRDSLFRSISEVTAGVTGHAMLIDVDGTPLICPVLSLEQHTANPAMVAAINEGQAGWVHVTQDTHGARDSLVGYAHLRIPETLAAESFRGRQWLTIVRQNPQETYAPLQQLLVKVAMYGLVVLGILWLAGLIVARKLVSPIQTLHEGVQRIGAGNWDHPLVLKTGDEIEALSHAFNKMAVNLKQSFSQLNTQMAEIRLLEERYRDLIENSPEMIHQIDKAGRFVHVNQTELEKLGFTLLEMLSMHLWDILPVERKAEALDYVNRLPTQPRSSLETVFLTRDGTPIDVEIHSTALIDSDTGDLVYTRAFVRDVTERKALQRQVNRYTTHLEQEVAAQTQQLSESEKRYRVLSEELEEKVQARTLEIQKTQKYLESLLENANDVIYTLDRDQRFTYVNNKVENWGYRKEDLLGRPFLTLLAKRHRSRRLKDILELEVKQEYEVEVISQSGELRSVLVSVSPLENERHNVIGVLGIARDITDRTLMEEQFRNAERLASVGKLAAGVAHEINNPLGGILNCLYNIRKGTLPSERQEEYFTYMEDGLRRAQKIVRQLLDFSQQHEPEFSMNDMNGLVDRVLVLTNHAIAEKRLQLHKVYDDDLPPLFVDPQMIEQVLTNLILNAVQATDEGGSIILQTRSTHERCEIDVGDTGPGIDPEVRPHIFDPFFTTKGTGEGTGLGLSVSLGIVERHGGQLTVESEIGKGTVFTVSLPLSANRAALVKVS
ncbi:MAG: PAS domain S-box protein [Nitrospira sp.]|nr:PAS domain S-box protein [Nitrospira sp.]MDE0486352.1 PAS domain S-box protein [Nitrospira sp.]